MINTVKIRKISSILLNVVVAMLVTMTSCKKDDKVNPETGLTKQQKSTDSIKPINIVIVTDKERQYLGEPMSMDKFIAAQSSFIEMATVKMNCYFVVSVNTDGTVQNQVLGVNTSHTLWRERLDGYFEFEKNYPDIDPLYGECREAKDKEELLKITNECLEKGWDYCVTTVRDKDGNVTGYTVCIENGL
jgi:hypothetical protein